MVRGAGLSQMHRIVIVFAECSWEQQAALRV